MTVTTVPMSTTSKAFLMGLTSRRYGGIASLSSARGLHTSSYAKWAMPKGGRRPPRRDVTRRLLRSANSLTHRLDPVKVCARGFMHAAMAMVRSDQVRRSRGSSQDSRFTVSIALVAYDRHGDERDGQRRHRPIPGRMAAGSGVAGRMDTSGDSVREDAAPLPLPPPPGSAVREGGPEIVSLARRAGALAIDSLVWLLAAIPVALAHPSLSPRDGFHPAVGFTLNGREWFLAGVPLLVTMIAWLAYMTVMEATAGASVGKLFTGVRVVTLEAQRPSWRAAAVRNAMRIVDVLPAFY
ncbi:MAG: RDD family protein, partial [Actinomycetota bacterium]